MDECGCVDKKVVDEMGVFIANVGDQLSNLNGDCTQS